MKTCLELYSIVLPPGWTASDNGHDLIKATPDGWLKAIVRPVDNGRRVEIHGAIRYESVQSLKARLAETANPPYVASLSAPCPIWKPSLGQEFPLDVRDRDDNRIRTAVEALIPRLEKLSTREAYVDLYLSERDAAMRLSMAARYVIPVAFTLLGRYETAREFVVEEVQRIGRLGVSLAVEPYPLFASNLMKELENRHAQAGGP